MSDKSRDKRDTEGATEKDQGNLSFVPKPNDKSAVVAILCSDFQISENPPISRSAEPDWYSAMNRICSQLHKLKLEYCAPIVFAGDLFERWNSPASLINFALEHLPQCYAVPGNHDLPNHSYKDIKRSAFYTLVKAGRVILLPPGDPYEVQELRLWGFPCGFAPKPCKKKSDLLLEVAVVHSYIWYKEHKHEGVDKKSHVSKKVRNLQGYDVAAFGDNHKGFGCIFSQEGRKLRVWNCGCLMRRKSDERAYKPSVGLLHGDGKITKHYLDCSEDKFLEVAKIAEILESTGFEEVIGELSALGDSAINFAEAVKHILEREKVPEDIKSIILNAMGVNK